MVHTHAHERRVSPVPVHDLVELFSGQEARVLPDLPQSSLELLFILVLQSLLLSLLSGAAALLSIVQAVKKDKLNHKRSR